MPQNAKYAGPQDEYICTGSDSGHAWIYERATGTVASFLSADQSTCNGVVPHPVLPFFITYGIDSTAKLWRATIPVDRDTDDSPLVSIPRDKISYVLPRVSFSQLASGSPLRDEPDAIIATNTRKAP
jgi:hypothetical protein